MTEKEKKYLSDISTSATWIQDFVRDTTSFSEYCRDQKTKSAVERHLGIIGEAVNKYLKESDSRIELCFPDNQPEKSADPFL